MRYRRNLGIGFLPGLLLVVGIIFFSVGAFGLHMHKSHTEMNKTEAEIIDIYSERRGTSNNRTWHVIVSYIDKFGNKQECELNSYSSNMGVGKKIDVYYSDDNPGKAYSGGTELLLGVVFTLVGGLLVAIGLFIAIGMAKSTRRIQKLKEEGKRVSCKLLGLRVNNSITVNGIHPTILDCEYTDEKSGVTYKLSSENIYNSIEIESDGIIYAYIDWENPRNYWVDTRELIDKSQTNTIDLRK